MNSTAKTSVNAPTRDEGIIKAGSELDAYFGHSNYTLNIHADSFHDFTGRTVAWWTVTVLATEVGAEP